MFYSGKKISQYKKSTSILYSILILVLFFQTTVFSQEKKLSVNGDYKVEVIVTKSSTSESMDKMKSTFKKLFNIDLNFSEIKRNKNNEILGLKIEAKGESVHSVFQNLSNKPIEPIRIYFESDGSKLAIGNFSDSKRPTQGFKHNYYSHFETDSTAANVFVIKNDVDLDEEYEWTDENGNKKIKKVFIKKDSTHFEKPTEKIIIIKKDGEKETIKQIEPNGNTVFFSNSSKEEPLVFINGKESDSSSLKTLSPDSIETVEVFKGEKAIEKYGEKAKNGVIEIKTKKS